MQIGNTSRQGAGFTYLGMLMIIAIAGIGMATVGVVWQHEIQREHEKELLFIGNAYAKALTRYYEATPSGIKEFPAKLEDLLQDNRGPVLKRHLRKMYADPMTHGQPWGLVMHQGKIMGIYSVSEQAPIKKQGFPQQYSQFAEAQTYQDWLFGDMQGIVPAKPVNAQSERFVARIKR